MIQAGDYEKDSIRLFGMFFTDTPVFFKTKEGIRLHIYDIATQYFLGTNKQRLIFGSFPNEMLQVVIKIMKDNKLDTIPTEKIDLQYITLFRKLFWNHPEVEQQLNELKKKYNRKSYIELYNTFLTEMAKLKIYTDEQQTHLREFRVYLGKKTIDFEGELSSDLYGDLYNFLEFSRYESNDFIKEKVKETLIEIVQAIECGDCPDIRTFKSFADRDQLPNNILSKLEKLVLYNYCDKPDPKVVEEIRAAVEMMDIDKLKEYLGFNPVGRQRYALVFESRQNMVIASRRSGKSYLSTYIAVRQLFLPGQMILYMLPIKEDYSEQPFFYIEQLLENVKKKGIELPGFQFNAKQFRVVNKVFKSKIIFLSAQGSSKGKSFSANLIVVDEAAMIADENLYDQAYNSTADTKGRIWAISTINVDTPVNRFFYNKIALEGIEDARIHNVDIYNNPFINAAEKADLERKYKDRNQNVRLADRMAIFVGGQDGFDVSKFFKIDFAYDVVTFKEQKFNLARNLDRYERFMVFYDPAKNKDKAGLVVIGKRRQAAEVVLTGYIDIKNYLLQWEVIIELIEYLSEIKPCEFGLDLGKAGEAALDRFESKKLAPYGILSTGGNESTRKTYRRRHVPAGMMESVLHALMAAGVVTGFSWLEFIRNEFDTYVLAKERRGNVGHHNDVLSALMNATYIWYERGMIGFENRPTEDKKNKKVPVDAYGRPIMTIQSGQFNGNRLSTFLH